MFKFVRGVIGGVVEVAGKVVKDTLYVATGIVTQIPASIVDEIAGEGNAVSEGLRSAHEELAGLTEKVVDKAAVPVVRAIACAPIRKVERVCDVIGGVAQATLGGEPEKGLERAGKAALGILAVVGTAGLIEAVSEHVEIVHGLAGEAHEHLGGAAGALADSHADAASGVADLHDQASSLLHEVPRASVESATWWGAQLDGDWGTISPAAPELHQTVYDVCATYQHPPLSVFEGSKYVANAMNSGGYLPNSVDDAVLFSRPFMEQVLQQPEYGTSAYHFIVNHEVGHSLLGRLNQAVGFSNMQWNNELWSDWFGGHALAQQGQPLDGAINWLRRFSPQGMNGHDPGFGNRIAALESGYAYARSQLSALMGDPRMGSQELWKSYQQWRSAFSVRFECDV